MNDIWSALGIEATADSATIRRAYATKLKRVRPDDDPAGFTALRAAYVAAMARCEAAHTAPAMQEAPSLVTVAPVPATPPHPAALALHRRDAASAAAALLAAQHDGSLGIGACMALADRLAVLLATDMSLPPDLVESIAGRFDWLGTQDIGSNRAVQAVRARVAAERWLTGLRAQSAGWLRRFYDDDSFAAALMLGRLPWWLGIWLPPLELLQMMMRQLHVHRAFVGAAFAPTRIRRLQRLLPDSPGFYRRHLLPVWLPAAFLTATSGSFAAGALAFVVPLRGGPAMRMAPLAVAGLGGAAWFWHVRFEAPFQYLIGARLLWGILRHRSRPVWSS